MNYQHNGLSNGKWDKLSFLEKMANIGTEVERALNWREKGNEEYSQQAFYRSLELFDLSMNNHLTGPQLKEVCRAREMWVDFYAYTNIYNSNAKQFRDYFMQLLIAFKMKS